MTSNLENLSNTNEINFFNDLETARTSAASFEPRSLKFGNALRSLLSKPLMERYIESDENMCSPNQCNFISRASLQPLSELNPMNCPFKQIVICGEIYYELCLLGKGASASVFKVVDRHGNLHALKRVRLKSLSNESQQNSALLADIGTEIDIMDKCKKSPFVIKLLAQEMVHELQEHLLLMEYGEVDAAQLIRESSFDIVHWFQVSLK
jgi:hypothetical protein